MQPIRQSHLMPWWSGAASPVSRRRWIWPSRISKWPLWKRIASIGGKMIRLSKVFPTLDCASCITTPKMAAAAHHENITHFHLLRTQVPRSRQRTGSLPPSRQKPRYVDPVKCIGCRQCEYGCPVYVPDEEQGGFSARKAIYIPFSNAIPQIAFWTRKTACCAANAKRSVRPRPWITFNKPEDFTIPGENRDPGHRFRSDPHGSESGVRCREDSPTSSPPFRWNGCLAPHGPYQRVLRPSDGKEPDSIAYIQCAGSRDKSLGIPYCSRVCCMYAIKQAMLLSGALPLADITIYYMDIRAFGKNTNSFFRTPRPWASNSSRPKWPS